MSESKRPYINNQIGLGFIWWLGGAFWVANQPGMGFWDGVVWLYYVGRYVAQHYTVLS